MHDPQLRDFPLRRRRLDRRNWTARNWTALAMLLLAAGCGSKQPTVIETTAVGTETVAPVVVETGMATSDNGTGAPAPGATPDFSVYLGKYPLDKVGNYAFFDHPVVVSGVAAAVTDPKVAAAIAAMKGPVGPVKKVGGDIAASRCELHNCGAHNYAVHVDAATNRVSSVCYYDEKAGPIATWFKPDGTKTSEGDGCSIG